MESHLESWAEVTSPDVLRALSNPELLKALSVFLGRERSVTQAAQDARLTVKRMHALTWRLLHLELLRVVRATPRAGRPIKVYTTVAPALFLPFEATSFDSFERALDRAEEPFRQMYFKALAQVALSSNTRWGLRVTREGKAMHVRAGAPFDHRALDGAQEAAMPLSWSLDMQLSFEEARSLEGELEALRTKYADKGGGQRYALRVAFAPVPSSLL